ncbi:hypothetical protein BJV78DRAFT_1353295, partial [Lactifluus subvellereus]
ARVTYRSNVVEGSTGNLVAVAHCGAAQAQVDKPARGWSRLRHFPSTTFYHIPASEVSSRSNHALQYPKLPHPSQTGEPAYTFQGTSVLATLRFGLPAIPGGQSRADLFINTTTFKAATLPTRHVTATVTAKQSFSTPARPRPTIR